MFNFQAYFYLIFPLEEIIQFKNSNMNINNQNNNSNNFKNNIQNQFYKYMNNIQILYNNYVANIQNSCIELNANEKNQLNSFLMNQNNAFNNYISNQQRNYNNMIMNNQQNLSNNNIIINNGEVNIYDCFEYYRKNNYMTGNDAMYCKFCKTTTNFYEQTDLTTGPEILLIILKKPRQANCYIKLIFYENLNLFNFIENKNLGYNYKLIGAIISFWENEKKNIVAYCRDPLNRKWYKYHDEIISEINDFQKEVINSSTPDLLIYEKIK
jgi:hypothetical protein